MEKKPLGADLVIPFLALAFATYFLVTTADLEWEAKANGVIIGSMLVLLIAVQLVRIGVELARGRASWSFAPLLHPRDALPKRIGMLAITIAFVATVPWLGLGLGLFIALAAGFAVMGVKGARRIALISFSIAAVCTLLFTVALDSSLPRGPVENLIAYARR
jgi:hypothetical protein